MTATRLFSRAVIRLSSTDQDEDVFDFLQGLVTNDVKGKLPAWAALLSPQGKVLFDFIVWSSGKDALIDCEAEAADDLKAVGRIARLDLVEADAIEVRSIELEEPPA